LRSASTLLDLAQGKQRQSHEAYWRMVEARGAMLEQSE
jgi:hypothetical protein